MQPSSSQCTPRPKSAAAAAAAERPPIKARSFNELKLRGGPGNPDPVEKSPSLVSNAAAGRETRRVHINDVRRGVAYQAAEHQSMVTTHFFA